MELVLKLARAIVEARQRRYSEISDRFSEEDHPRELHGRCPRNAYLLSTILWDFGINHQVICGGLKTDWLRSPPGTIENTREEGFVHYWCETVETGIPRYIIDIASEVEGHEGLPLLTQELPKEYVYLVDGMDFQFDPAPITYP